MDWLKSKTAMIAGGCLAIIGLQGYGMMSMRSTMDERIRAVENDMQEMQKQNNSTFTKLASQLQAVTKNNAEELQDTQQLAVKMQRDNVQTTKRLRRELAAKADSKTVMQYHDETTNKLSEYQQDTTTKIAGVSGDVQGVRTDLNSTRTDLNATREDLANSKRDLGTLIARNSTELAELRRRGERDYVEFDLRKTKDFQHVGDILVQLRKTDVKRQKFDVVINTDDKNILKKDRTANEPVTFLVGHDRVRYEFVVYSVDKDRVRGYISTPKDKLVAAENPLQRRLQ
jgi:predicted  nucleic acid-binding Zn-ribbon protein